jgi:hypothetical protein
MRLENFDLVKPFGQIWLRGLGHSWDLHNFVVFKGLAFHPERNEMVLEWRVGTSRTDPWCSPGNNAAGCRLRFTGVRSVSLSPRDAAFALDESTCLEMISKVVPGEREYPFKQSWGPDEPFNLRLDFQDDRRIEVDAESVSLEAIP